MPENGRDPVAIIVVADGHGGAEYVRSHVGSKLAVDVASAVLFEYLVKPPQPTVVASYPDLRLHKQLAAERIPPEIARRWQALAAENLQQHPLADTELEIVQSQPSRRTLKSPASVYGTTVLGVMATQDYIVYLQNGDGDILVVEDDGRVRRPLPPGRRLLGNETTSLAARDSWKDFRITIEPVGPHPPALILAATDGYANSFAVDEDFIRVATDLLANIIEKGASWTMEQLPTWLNETSANGSGDDISLAIILREEPPPKYEVPDPV